MMNSVVQREAWEQQGVHSGSDATLAPLSYRLDHRAVVIHAAPNVSECPLLAHLAIHAPVKQDIAVPVQNCICSGSCSLSQQFQSVSSAAHQLPAMSAAATSCLPACLYQQQQEMTVVVCRGSMGIPAQHSSLQCPAAMLLRQRGPSAKRRHLHGHPAQVPLAECMAFRNIPQPVHSAQQSDWQPETKTFVYL